MLHWSNITRDVTSENPMESLSSGVSDVLAENSCDLRKLRFVVIIIQTYTKLAPKPL